MGSPKPTIQFEHKGIGQALNDKRLRVPLNQREYAWEDEHVEDLFRDLHDAERSDETEYFLGTIVLTPGEDGIPQIADGQQRLATTTILLAAIRDFLIVNKEARKAQLIDDRYLQTPDLRSDETLPRLRLNVADDEYFRKTILSPVGSEDRKHPASKPSHDRIQAAAALAQAQVERIVSGHTMDKQATRLVDWVDFIRDKARVILVTVPDEYDAFRMFETLNDRGVEAAQSDLLKNYLLGRSGDRMDEVQQRWASMVGALESASRADMTVKYLRHFWITQHGPTRERDLFNKIKEEIRSKNTAVALADSLADDASLYVSLLSPQHESWNQYGTRTRRCVGSLLLFGVEQIRPLQLSVVRQFTVEEARKAFQLFVAWSVRFLIVGGGRGGLLDKQYGLLAKDVAAGLIKTTAQLSTAMVGIVPNDATFEAAFAVARVSSAPLARYYLRMLEQTAKGFRADESMANDDEGEINLEHILPENPGAGWLLDADAASALYRRIGNMVLLRVQENVALGNLPYAEKAETIKNSTLVLTAQAGVFSTWDARSIDERQRKLAALAVNTWPLTVS